MKYIVRQDFDYEPAYGDVNNKEQTTHFKRGEVYEFEPYLGKCHKDGEMSLKTHILTECNNGWVWKAEDFNKHFELALDVLVHNIRATANKGSYNS